jgi:hypothetical protein
MLWPIKWREHRWRLRELLTIKMNEVDLPSHTIRFEPGPPAEESPAQAQLGRGHPIGTGRQPVGSLR